MPVFFICSRDIRDSRIVIDDPLFTHLHKSLRVQPGHHLALTDEQRRRYRVEIIQVKKNHLIAEVQDTQCGPDIEEPSIILGQAVLKGEKMNWVIQKATELGITKIFPLLTERVITRLTPAQAEHHRARWQRIALEAAQQAERWDVPTICEAHSLSEFCTMHLATERALILTERVNSHSLSTITFPSQWKHSLILVVGPEGGWSEGELRTAEEAGFQNVSLGTRILRSETAALAALSIVQARLGHME